MVLFAGPYEVGKPCLGAEGLLFMYNYMGQNLKMALKEDIRSEVQSVLLDVANKRNVDLHVRMHDDGEISEQISELDGCPSRLYPPQESPYTFVYTVKDNKGNKMPLQEFVKIKEETEKQHLEQIAALEQNNAKLIAELQSTKEPLAELEAMRAMEDRKRKRKEAFCVRGLIAERKLDIEETDVGTLCKEVIRSFKENFPENEVFVKHGATYFYPEVSPCIL